VWFSCVRNEVSFSFGPFTLDDATRQLLRGADPIHLSPKAFELLKALVEARPRARSKGELHERLWPNTFVTDANLGILIAEVRSALDDDARAPQYVRTLHGFGYAFLGTALEVTRAGRRPALSGVSYWLIWRKKKFALAEGDNLVGRSPRATVWVDVAGVSREHARVTIEHGSAILEDLGSRNGTFRAGARLSGPVVLQDRDRIQLGPVLMTFRVWVPGAGTETQDVNGAKPPAS
jgi:DNA-binding winged helix-turn-helix (wHTH) protein